jgi:hypothetical protein
MFVSLKAGLLMPNYLGFVACLGPGLNTAFHGVNSGNSEPL